MAVECRPVPAPFLHDVVKSGPSTDVAPWLLEIG